MKSKLFVTAALLIAAFAFGQVGVNTENPQGIFNIDGAKDNPATGTPTAVQQANDFVVMPDGKVGIGTTSPGTSLDVTGAITHRETSVTIAANAATVAANTSMVRLTGTATAAIAVTVVAAPNAGQRLVVYNNTAGGFVATLNGFSIANGLAVEFVYSNGSWHAIDNGVVNLYNTNGTLTGNRIVTQGANALAFTATETNGFSVDGTTFSVDAKNDRIGIGTATPNTRLEVSSGTNNVSGLRLTNLTNTSPSTANTAPLGVDANGNVVVNALTSQFRSFDINANTPANSEVRIGNLEFRFNGTGCGSGASGNVQVRTTDGSIEVGLLHNVLRNSQSATLMATQNNPLTITPTYSNVVANPMDCFNDGSLTFLYYSAATKALYSVSVIAWDGDGIAAVGNIGYIYVERQR